MHNSQRLVKNLQNTIQKQQVKPELTNSYMDYCHNVKEENILFDDDENAVNL